MLFQILLDFYRLHKFPNLKSISSTIHMNISIFSIDLLQVYQQKYPPPLIPPRGEVNAADAFDIGSFDEEDTKGTKY